MKTYNSYQEAKIDNPNYEIIQSKSLANVFGVLEVDVYAGWIKCDPADHCMTVEQFLNAGHEFVDGDWFINHLGEVKRIGKIIKGNNYTPEEANSPDDFDDNCHILRAAALNKPKRVKFECIECDNLQDALDKFESMAGFEFYPDKNGAGERINSVRNLAMAYGHGSLYLKVETPIEWWGDAVDFAKQCKHVNTAVYLPEYDSIDIDGSMTRDEACDFARILLEQGED